MQNGYDLSNGMKVKFYGKVTPEKYATGSWYVEGVGDSITLVPEQDVILTADYLLDDATEFDEAGFGNRPLIMPHTLMKKIIFVLINLPR